MGARTVRVLGELSVDGLDARSGLDRKARTLLRLLALARGRPVPAEALVEALWGDRPPVRPFDQVAVLASRIRKQLGRDAVEHGDHGYRLGAVPVDLDELAAVVGETERRLGTGEVASAVATARVAVSMLHGPLPEAGTDADWAVADHAAAVRLVLHARRISTAALLEAGAWPDALDLASADWAADPFDEVAVRVVMRAEVAAGRPARALNAFAALRTTLADELGADPDRATTDLHAEILRGEATSPVRSAARPLLIGRASQIDHLDSLVSRVRSGTPRIAVLTGDAGIGKTTLLRSWAQSRAAAGDTVLAGTCGPLDRSAPLDVVLIAIADHLRRAGDAAQQLGEEGALLAALTAPGADRSAAADPVLGPATLYAAVIAVLAGIAGSRGAVLLIDDAHLAGPALAEWMEFLRRRQLPLLVVAAARPAEGPRLPFTDEVRVGPLDLADTARLVGAERAAELHARSGGHPLFLSELAGAASRELPASLVAAVLSRCEELGDAADLVRAAATLGGDLDVELLAAVLSRAALDVLADIESAADRGLLVERDGRYTFRHELVREALAAGTPPSRASLLHREAARALARRTDADPAAVAEHARQGEDAPLAATWLVRAAQRASARFDHPTAARLLEESLALRADDDALLAQAQVRIRTGRYADAEADAVAVRSDPAAGSEIAAWAAYFDRRFDDAVRHTVDGELLAADETARVRCLIAAGRIRHARGDLAEAERRLTEAAAVSSGTERLTAAAWLGVLLAHRSRTTQALDLLRPATRPGVGVDQTSAVLHALLFTGHAQATAGRVVPALAAFERYTNEVERRQVPRFGGRGTNFGGWVLRNLGATAAGLDAHQQALDLVGTAATSELEVAALEDLAEQGLQAGELDAASAFLDRAEAALVGDLVFGWRLAMKLRLLRARHALETGEPAVALELAAGLRRDAADAGVPRYASVAAVVAHQARAALGEPTDLDQVARDLEAVAAAVRLEAWWWAGDTGARLREPRLLAQAESLAAELARGVGVHADTLHAEADRRLTSWRLTSR